MHFQSRALSLLDGLLLVLLLAAVLDFDFLAAAAGGGTTALVVEMLLLSDRAARIFSVGFNCLGLYSNYRMVMVIQKT